ncbi:RWD domain-containing protein [Toxoplasma gondii GAB2-2007-GAL-DOM2]|uniref:RWD domain-containing protein n=1 Tax=Toxoplasma gondii GAB2-2007-GAL-DOM2 TaxID=1130820 RepID=A0A086JS57_TOXGO|nr:RWD domain-containing protein [Toxoplasma gondii GAB2-2007-GAL-DOM2]
MTNHTEEQALELEALEALFTREEEFEKLSPTSFRLSLLPCQEGEGTDHVAVTLLVEYVPTYPDDPPHWEIQSSKGLDTEALEELKKEVSEAMKREVGAPMMYTIAEFVQDWLRERNKPQQSMYDQMMSRENAAVVEDESDEEEEEGDGDEPQYTGLGDKQLCAATTQVAPKLKQRQTVSTRTRKTVTAQETPRRECFGRMRVSSKAKTTRNFCPIEDHLLRKGNSSSMHMHVPLGVNLHS